MFLGQKTKHKTNEYSQATWTYYLYVCFEECLPASVLPASVLPASVNGAFIKTAEVQASKFTLKVFIKEI